jgi:hypothetical protein
MRPSPTSAGQMRARLSGSSVNPLALEREKERC